MPRLVDHEVRRRQLTNATRRVIAQQGLNATTFVSVATEAGVSVRLVQYYFGDKNGLLASTLAAVISDASDRFTAASVDHSTAMSDRLALVHLLYSLIPKNVGEIRDATALLAFHVAAVTVGNDDMSVSDTNGPVTALEHLIARSVGAWRNVMPGDRLVVADAQLLAASLAGIIQAVLSHHISADTALILLERLVTLVLAQNSSEIEAGQAGRT